MACGENARGEGSIVDEEKLGLVTIRYPTLLGTHSGHSKYL